MATLNELERGLHSVNKTRDRLNKDYSRLKKKLKARLSNLENLLMSTTKSHEDFLAEQPPKTKSKVSPHYSKLLTLQANIRSLNMLIQNDKHKRRSELLLLNIEAKNFEKDITSMEKKFNKIIKAQEKNASLPIISPKSHGAVKEVQRKLDLDWAQVSFKHHQSERNFNRVVASFCFAMSAITFAIGGVACLTGGVVPGAIMLVAGAFFAMGSAYFGSLAEKNEQDVHVLEKLVDDSKIYKKNPNTFFEKANNLRLSHKIAIQEITEPPHHSRNRPGLLTV